MNVSYVTKVFHERVILAMSNCRLKVDGVEVRHTSQGTQVWWNEIDCDLYNVVRVTQSYLLHCQQFYELFISGQSLYNEQEAWFRAVSKVANYFDRWNDQVDVSCDTRRETF